LPKEVDGSALGKGEEGKEMRREGGRDGGTEGGRVSTDPISQHDVNHALHGRQPPSFQ